MFHLPRCLCLVVLYAVCCGSPLLAAATESAPPVPDDFPQFVVPGHEQEMDSLRRLFWLHYRPAGPLIPLWDEWMPMSTLWPALGEGNQLDAMRMRWAAALASRGMNGEGYVHTHQHDGLAHAEGWPFPLWTQAGGIGWHFRGTGVRGYDAPPATPDGWTLVRAKGATVGDKGWEVELTEPQATLQTPPFSIDARISPWLRLNWWAQGLEGANCYVEWTTTEHPEFSPQRRAYFSPATRRGQSGSYMPMGGGGGKLNTDTRETRTMIPVYRLPEWKGTITGVRIGLDNAGPAQLVIKSFHTACDSRHNINNSNFIRGCHDYFMWSGDYAFLRSQIGRIRTAMRFIMREFDTRNRHCVYTTWVGHEGRSGVRIVDGKKVIVVGEGIGSNYWDLLPFGGEDALGTIYYYDALLDLAELEENISTTPNGAWPPAPTRSIHTISAPTLRRSRTTEQSGSGTRRPAGLVRSTWMGTCMIMDSRFSITRRFTTVSRPSHKLRVFMPGWPANGLWRAIRLRAMTSITGGSDLGAPHAAISITISGVGRHPSRFLLATRCRTAAACWDSRITT